MIISFALHLFCSIISCVPTFSPPEAPKSELLRGRRGGEDETKFSNLSSNGERKLTTRESSGNTNGHSKSLNGSPLVFLKNGDGLEGFYTRTVNGRRVRSFQSVPFGEAPIGKLRFMPPVPKKSWNGKILQAKKSSPVCLQLNSGENLYMHRIDGVENCLYLSIYVPEDDEEINQSNSDLYPVIIYIHGGVYLKGSSTYFGPAYLLDQNVILVNINYRLGVLGFLSVGNGVGNMGLKDQYLAIKWIYDNIKSFGGNPNKIVLFGHDAGASSVNLHLISNLTKNLVYAAIMQSGSAFMHWSLVNKTVQNSFKIAEKSGCETKNTTLMVECLRSLNPYMLVNNQKTIYNWMFYPMALFGPIVEKPSIGSFIDNSPEVLYERKEVAKVPIICGIVENEGDFYTQQQIIYSNILPQMTKNWKKLLPFVLDFNEFSSKEKASKEIKEFYFGKAPINIWSRRQISKMIGDRMIVDGVYKLLQTHSKIAPTYGYFFSFKGKFSTVANLMSGKRNEWGVTHFDDMYYLLNSTLYFPPINIKDPEYEVSDLLTNIYANFATNRKPIYTLDDEDIDFWEPVSQTKDMKVLNINQDPKMISFPYEIRMDFLQSLKLSTNI